VRRKEVSEQFQRLREELQLVISTCIETPTTHQELCLESVLFEFLKLSWKGSRRRMLSSERLELLAKSRVLEVGFRFVAAQSRSKGGGLRIHASGGLEVFCGNGKEGRRSG